MMYSNLAKFPAFPLAIRASSQPKCFKLFTAPKSQSLPIGSVKNTDLCSYSTRRVVGMNSLENFSTGPGRRSGTIQSIGRKRRSHHLKRLTSLASKEGNSRVAAEKKEFPKPRRSTWEESAERLEKANVKSSWEQSAKRLEKVGHESSSDESATRSNRESKQSSPVKFSKSRDASSFGVRERRNRVEDVVEDREKVNGNSRLPWLASKEGHNNYNNKNKVWVKRREFPKPGSSTWEESPVRHERVSIRSSPTNVIGESRSRNVDVIEDKVGNGLEENEEEEEESEIVSDPRWDRIRTRYEEAADARDRYERPELRKWNNHENWGRKTWKEATTESSVPKMVGEGVYGVGPVLAALSSGRREFYALYVQEGLDPSNNNSNRKKKKDKKGFEGILKMAEKLELRIKGVSKHDLNMVTDNRPHQGLVLDASPLEMVKVRELDRVTAEEDKRSLWVALDEVTDPQNLGAIVRSAYFFGATGVVLCAKNSAPLSGVVSKASAGSLELMELRFCKNMMQFLIFSAENGWRVLGGSVSPSAVPLNEVAPGVPTILVLGSEGAGLRTLVEKSCTQLVRIDSNASADMVPDGGGGGEQPETSDFRSFLAVESLNVSVAAGVFLHHLIGEK